MNRLPVAYTLVGLLAAAVFTAGCATNAPLDTLHYAAVDDERQPRLLIFLRGRGGSHKDYEKHGFVADIKKRGLPYDMRAPNAHIGYYVGRSLVQRLKADVIDPARAAGYREVWLVGASMGGLGALLYAKFHPGDIDGVYLISPFLGHREVISEIIFAGGLAAWEPGAYDPEEDWQIMLWDWIKNRTAADWDGTPVFLGYGEADMFADAHMLLGANLPPGHVFTAPGGHTPQVMRQVWLNYLDAGGLAH
jgi:pimeloyl-ACP methyl ester carboxylesterase